MLFFLFLLKQKTAYEMRISDWSSDVCSSYLIVRGAAQLERYMTEAVKFSGKSPVLIDSYLSDAIEVDVDCLADAETQFVAGVMEHIEEAGIHSGDSACALPPYSLSAEVIADIKEQTRALARALRVVGLMKIGRAHV